MRLPRTCFVSSIGQVISYAFVIFVLALFLSLAAWHTSARSSNEGVGLFLDKNNKIVRAEFKGSHVNPDNSIDIIFRVYQRNETALSVSQQLGRPRLPTGSGAQRPSKDGRITSPAVTDPGEVSKGGDVTTEESSITRSTYPLTLDREFLINTLTLCPLGKPVDYLVIVHSAIAYFRRRRGIRETYGGRGVFGNVTQRVVFLLGTTSDPKATRAIQWEALQHGDIVQGLFTDSYHNLTHKAVMGFRWAALHCPQARLVVKIDDDVFINTFRLISDILPAYTTRKRHIACHLRPEGTSSIQRGKGRWKVHEDMFKGYQYFPFDYCNGYFVVITPDLILPLLRAVRLSPYFWIDDVYMFGVLPAAVGSVKFTDLTKQLVLSYKVGQSVNPDNSIDLIFRVYQRNDTAPSVSQQLGRPRLPTGSGAQRLSKDGRITSPAVTDPGEVSKGGDVTTEESSITRSTYPLTLDREFLINTLTLCPLGKPVDYLVIVHSAIAYFRRRRGIRETYGGRGVFGNVTQRVVFLLGTTSDPKATRAIQWEALQHGDIVQGLFTDSYHNLTHKAVMGFRWAALHCPQARLVVKIDDDVFINTFRLISDILPVYTTQKRHIACHLRREGTSFIQRGKGRWKVHEDMFKGYQYFPFDYCNGYFVVITPDLILPLLRAVRLSPYFWIDDVYMFGVLPAAVGSVKFTDLTKQLVLSYKVGQRCVDEKGLGCHLLAVSQFKEQSFENLWYSLLSNITDITAKKVKLFGAS